MATRVCRYGIRWWNKCGEVGNIMMMIQVDVELTRGKEVSAMREALSLLRCPSQFPVHYIPVLFLYCVLDAHVPLCPDKTANPSHASCYTTHYANIFHEYG
jgi:hypothetical protein